MAIDAELYDLVHAGRKKQKEMYGKVKARELGVMIGRNGAETLAVNRQIEAIELAEAEIALEKKFHKGLRDELSKFGEVYADEKCQVLRQAIESYQDTEEALHEVISDLEGKQADSERTIEELRQSNIAFEKNRLEQRGEIKALTMARDKADDDRSRAEAKFAGLKVTVDQRSRELREERQKAKNLQKKLAEATALNERRQAEIDRLESGHKAAEVALAAEQKARTAAQSRIDELSSEIDKLKKRKASTRAAASTSTNDK